MYNVGKCLLSDLLQQKGVTQQQLANELNVTKQQINKYCLNEVIMSLPIAINIAAILKCNISNLYELHFVEVRNKRR